MSHGHRLAGKKVLFIFGSLELGGAERQGFLLSQYLRESQDVIVEVYGFGGRGKLSDMCEKNGIAWQSIALPIAGGSVKSVVHYSRSAASLFSALRRSQADILLPYTLHPNVWCGIFWRMTEGVTCVWNQRDEGLGYSGSCVQRLALRNTPLFAANSEGGARFLASQGVNKNKIHLIRNSVFLGKPKRTNRQWRKALGSDDKTFLALMIANISSMKDHDTLLRAWSLVCESDSPGNRSLLLLAGRFDDRTNHIKSLIREFGLEKRVLLLGPVDDIYGLLSCVDIVVHSSISEGTPNAILEAMAAGRIVVATDIPGIRSIVGIDNLQFLTPVHDSNLMAKKIIYVRSNMDRLKEIEIRNQKRVLKQYGYEEMGKKYTDVISSALE
ncbi:MAG: glycosyltransferase [Spirochaetes bacterium]|nr:glycosyltransferase [Spirochaetota bacterium]